MRKRAWGKVLAACLSAPIVACLALTAAGLVPMKAYSEENSIDYVIRSWDGSKVVETSANHRNAAWMTNGHKELHDGWWYTRDVNVTIDEPVKVDEGATANIILMNGVTMRFEEGIYVPASSTLNIYGQAGDSGALDVIADVNCSAGIGGREKEPCGTINIYGGKVYAVGDDNSSSSGEGGAGIGGGDETGGGNISIYGGNVTGIGATNAAGIGGGDGEDNKGGGKSGAIKIYGGTVKGVGGSASSEGGAGIGSGAYSDCETIEIYGGKVIGRGGPDAAGIGGGWKGNGGTITIKGGDIDAKGGSENEDGGAGIGGGGEGASGTITIDGCDNLTAHGGANAAGIGGGDEGDCGTITINGGTVNAYGGSTNTDGGAGIGGGNEKNGGTVKVNGGVVTAQGGADGAGIGGGDCGNGGNIEIRNATVNATGGVYGAGIGGGDADSSGRGHGGTVKIYAGGNVAAQGGADAAGIGGGEGGSGATIDIYDGATVHAWGGNIKASSDGGAGIGSGDSDGKSVNGGTVTIHGGTVNATGAPDAAGIGGGDDASGGVITIEGGTVTATGGILGAGIGGGQNGNGGGITIQGGTVTASSPEDGAGIGGGEYGSGGDIIISGGTITATGGSTTTGGGAGIGGGDERGGAGYIRISGCEKIIANGGHGGAGIGGGMHGNTGRIDITGGNIEAAGKDGGAGIGSGYNYSSESDEQLTRSIDITINNATITAKGGKYGAGIGGGKNNFSGKIVIDGGTINATGGENGGSGIGSGTGCAQKDSISGNLTTVDITINGGTINAFAGAMVSRDSYEPGAAIGAGGLMYNSDDSEAPGYFNGSIVFNGGTVNAYGAATNDPAYVTDNDKNSQVGIGASNSKGLAGVTGTVAFNGATVTVFPGFPNVASTDESQRVYAQAVRASNITFKDEGGWHQSVQYKQLSQDPVYAPLGERAAELTKHVATAGVYNWLKVEPKHTHSFTYSSDGATITAQCADTCDLPDHKATLTIAAPQHAVYGDGKDAAAVITDENDIKGAAEVKYYKATKSGDTYTKGEALTAAPTDAGDYLAEITLGADSNQATASVGYTIAKAPSPVVVTGGANVSENSSVDLAKNVTLNGAAGAITYDLLSENLYCSVDEAGVLSVDKGAIPDGSDTTTVTVKVTVAADSNYEEKTESIIVQVSSLPVPTITAADVTVTFGDTNAKVTADVRGTISGHETDCGTISYHVEEGFEDYIGIGFGTGALTLKKVGTAYARVQAGSNGIYAYVEKLVKVTISKASITPSVSLEGWTYGAAAKEPVVSGNAGNAAVTYEYKPAGADDSAYSTAAPKQAGTYVVRAIVTGSDNYLGATTEPAEFTIAKKEITADVVAQHKTYDGTTDANISASVNDADLAAGDNLVITGLSGSFATKDAGENKEVVLDTSNVAVNGMGAANYTVKFPDVKATINKRPATVTADSFTKVYGEADPEFTASVEGVVSGEALEYSLSRDTGVDIGECDINVTLGNNPNYDVRAVKGKLVISTSKLIVTATGYSGVYDGQAHGISVDVKPTSEALVYYSAAELTASNYREAGSTNPVTFTDAGTKTIYYLVDAPGYNPVTGSADIVIGKAAPKVVAPQAAGSLTYNGKAQVLVIAGSAKGGTMEYSLDGKTWSKDVPTATEAGSYSVFYRVVGDFNYEDVAAKSVTVAIAKAGTSKAANGLKAKGKTVKLKAKKLKKKAQKVKAKKLFKVKGASGKVTYKLSKVKKSKFKKYFKLTKKGKLTVKKKLKKGTYTLKVKVTAAGDANHASATKTVTVKVKVK